MVNDWFRPAAGGEPVSGKSGRPPRVYSGEKRNQKCPAAAGRKPNSVPPSLSVCALAGAASSFGETTIPLDPALLAGSSSLPGDFGRAVLKRLPIWPCSVRGFACHQPYSRRGALLPHLFTLTPSTRLFEARSGQALAGLPRAKPRSGESRGGLFSVPLSFELPRPGVTRRTALWSSDFPPAFDFGFGSAGPKACLAEARSAKAGGCLARCSRTADGLTRLRGCKARVSPRFPA